MRTKLDRFPRYFQFNAVDLMFNPTTRVWDVMGPEGDVRASDNDFFYMFHLVCGGHVHRENGVPVTLIWTNRKGQLCTYHIATQVETNQRYGDTLPVNTLAEMLAQAAEDSRFREARVKRGKQPRTPKQREPRTVGWSPDMTSVAFQAVRFYKEEAPTSLFCDYSNVIEHLKKGGRVLTSNNYGHQTLPVRFTYRRIDQMSLEHLENVLECVGDKRFSEINMRMNDVNVKKAVMDRVAKLRLEKQQEQAADIIAAARKAADKFSASFGSMRPMMLPPSPALAKLEELDEGMEAMKRTYGDKEFVNTFELMVDIIKTLAKGGNQ